MPEEPWTPRTRSDWLLLAGIVLVAFLVRAVPVLRGGGLDGFLGYDDGVYFAAAAGLVNGVLPYRDFLLLHPPGIALLLSPFALLAGATDGATGFAAARVAFMAIGALNAGLVTLVAGRYGRRAALIGGGLYAVWYAAARAERTLFLLGPQTTLLLLAVLILLSGRPLRMRRAAVAGALLGAAAAIQVWAVVPIAVVAVSILLGWLGLSGDRRRATIGLLGGAVVALAAVCLPFFAAAPARFISYVLTDQIDRPSLDIGLVTRLRVLEGFSLAGNKSLFATAAFIGLAIVGAIAVVVVARRMPAARMWCVLAAVETAYLLVAPNFFTHYSAWLAPVAAIVLGTAASLAIGAVERSPRLFTVAQVGAVGVVAAMAVFVPRTQGTVIERTALEADIRNAGCVSADDPELLIVTSGLLRDLRRGCPLVVDPTGTSYDTDRGRLAAGPVGKARLGAPGYQYAMEEWYDDSNAALFARGAADGLDAATREEIADELPVVVPQGNVTVMLPGAHPLP